jgi:tRNA U34 5-carboxymethylaminomethyl modifying GTPase MnmE/TrmE
MNQPTCPTTVAMQTPPGRGGIAVLSLRGPAAEAILAEAFRPSASGGRGPTGGQGELQLGHIVDGARVIDQAIVARCGELAEINIHGGSAVAAAVLRRLLDLGAVVVPTTAASAGCFRPDHPAMHNPAIGKEMLQVLPSAASARVASVLTWQWSAGLSQLAAEVLDSISRHTGPSCHCPTSRPPADATDPAQAGEAQPQAGTADGLPVVCQPSSDELRATPKPSRCNRDLRLGSAVLGHPQADSAWVWHHQFRLDGMPACADALRAAARRRAMMRRVLCPPAGRYAEVVLAGPPNAGKSTLANALLGRAASIVHDRPGTTRDWVRELALLRGLPVWLTDTAGLWEATDGLWETTAGLWEATDGVDAEAVRRSAHRIAAADLVLLLGAGRLESLPDWLDKLRLPPGATAPATSAVVPMLAVATKIDLIPPQPDADAAVCAPTGQGLDELAARIIDALGLADFHPRLPLAFTDRQEALLARAADALDAGQTDKARASLAELLG